MRRAEQISKRLHEIDVEFTDLMRPSPVLPRGSVMAEVFTEDVFAAANRARRRAVLTQERRQLEKEYETLTK